MSGPGADGAPRPGGGVELVLWDVDGTLITAARTGRDAFFAAFEAVTGHAPRELVPFAGRTDLEIAHDLLETAGVEAGEELLERFEEELVAAMAARVDALRERGHALPGAAAALERVAQEPDVVQSLLTGNVERNALVKLKTFDLVRHLDFASGAYGSDHRSRGELVAIARERARRRHGAAIAGVVLIGDTPLDVAAAREGGARAVAVATGPYDRRALEECGADVVLDDLADTGAVVAAVLGRAAHPYGAATS